MEIETYYCAKCKTVFTEKVDFCPNCEPPPPPEYALNESLPSWYWPFDFIVYFGLLLMVGALLLAATIWLLPMLIRLINSR